MWQYSQSSGALLDATGKLRATGYSGHGDGLNNPDMQNVADVGPIPRGLWSIGAPVNCSEFPNSSRPELAHLGPFALPLIPHADTDCCGRNGFFCHGDEVGHVGEHLASEGCIILDRATRETIWASGDHTLKVTE